MELEPDLQSELTLAAADPAFMLLTRTDLRDFRVTPYDRILVAPLYRAAVLLFRLSAVPRKEKKCWQTSTPGGRDPSRKPPFDTADLTLVTNRLKRKRARLQLHMSLLYWRVLSPGKLSWNSSQELTGSRRVCSLPGQE